MVCSSSKHLFTSFPWNSVLFLWPDYNVSSLAAFGVFPRLNPWEPRIMDIPSKPGWWCFFCRDWKKHVLQLGYDVLFISALSLENKIWMEWNVIMTIFGPLWYSGNPIGHLSCACDSDQIGHSHPVACLQEKLVHMPWVFSCLIALNGTFFIDKLDWSLIKASPIMLYYFHP